MFNMLVQEQFNGLSTSIKFPHLVSTLRTAGASEEVLPYTHAHTLACTLTQYVEKSSSDFFSIHTLSNSGGGGGGTLGGDAPSVTNPLVNEPLPRLVIIIGR